VELVAACLKVLSASKKHEKASQRTFNTTTTTATDYYDNDSKEHTKELQLN
jgi:hypothetical protein